MVRHCNFKPSLRAGGGAAIFAMIFTVFSLAVWSQSNDPAQLEHPKVPNPATLTGARAESVYQAIRGQMRNGYLQADDPIAEAYQTWRRYNIKPYRSPNHGERYVNHYGNVEAKDYAKFENLSPLPKGAIIVKDSFTVTRNGDLKSGRFFMMEKMEAGFPSQAGSWRFMMLRGDGTLVGVTNGVGSDNVRFCGTCHRNAGPNMIICFSCPGKLG